MARYQYSGFTTVPHRPETGPEESGVTVAREAYEQAIGRSLDTDSEELVIDERGYAEEVADVLGEDYLENRVLLFSSEQLDISGDETVSETLTRKAGENELFRELVQEYGPVALAYDIDVGKELAVNARIDPSCSSQTVADLDSLSRSLSDMRPRELKNYDHVSNLVDAAGSVKEALPYVELFDQPVVTVSSDQAKLQEDGYAAFLFQTGDVYAVTVGTAEEPVQTEGYWQQTEITTVMEELQEHERIQVDEVAGVIKLELMAEPIIRALEEEYMDEDGVLQHAKQLVNLRSMDVEEKVPEEFDALVSLLGEEDISMDTAAEREKLGAVDGTDAFTEDLIDSMQEAYRAEEPMQAWRHGVYEMGPEDLVEAYNTWQESRFRHSYRQFIPDKSYGADAVTEFCEDVDLAGERDGKFLTNLVAGMADEEVVVGDLSDVDYFGYFLEDKHVIIEGNTGDYLGAFLDNGATIEVKGETGRRLGIGSKGGEIYLHAGSQEISDVGATVYVKRNGLTDWLFGKDKWTRVN